MKSDSTRRPWGAPPLKAGNPRKYSSEKASITSTSLALGNAATSSVATKKVPGLICKRRSLVKERQFEKVSTVMKPIKILDKNETGKKSDSLEKVETSSKPRVSIPAIKAVSVPKMPNNVSKTFQTQQNKQKIHSPPLASQMKSDRTAQMKNERLMHFMKQWKVSSAATPIALNNSNNKKAVDGKGAEKIRKPMPIQPSQQIEKTKSQKIIDRLAETPGQQSIGVLSPPHVDFLSVQTLDPVINHNLLSVQDLDGETFIPETLVSQPVHVLVSETIKLPDNFVNVINQIPLPR